MSDTACSAAWDPLLAHGRRRHSASRLPYPPDRRTAASRSSGRQTSRHNRLILHLLAHIESLRLKTFFTSRCAGSPRSGKGITSLSKSLIPCKHSPRPPTTIKISWSRMLILNQRSETSRINAEFVGFLHNSKRIAIALFLRKTGHSCPAENSQLPFGQQKHPKKPDIHVRFLAPVSRATPPRP
jgi:hypothetical protein